MLDESTMPQDNPFETIFRNHNAVMLLIDPESGRIVDANISAITFYGYSLELFKSMTIADLTALPQEKLVKGWLHALLQERNFIFPHRLASGNVRTVELNMSPIQWGGARVLFSIVNDITVRQKTEEALRESEERYHSLFDRMMDGIYRSTHEGKFVDVNPAMVAMFGYSSKEEMLKIDIKKELYFSPEERGSHILDTGMEEIEVYRMRRKDGSEIWVEDHGYYVHDDQGNILFHEGMLRDVTERVRAEAAFRENDTLLRETQRIGGIGPFCLGFLTGFWKSSDTLDRILGIDDSYERSIQGWVNLVHPGHREWMVQYFTQDVIVGKNRFDREYKIIRQNDGAERWVHGMGELEVNAGGDLLNMKGTIQDVTSRKQMEDDLRQSLVELEALYKISSSLRSAQTLEEAMPALLDQTLAAMATDTGTILLYDPKTNELRDTNPRGWFDDLKDIRINIGEGVAGNVFSTGQMHVSEEFIKDPLVRPDSLARIPAGWGGACLPIRSSDEVVGVLFIAVQLPSRITPEQIKLLHSLTEIAGSIIERTRLFEETARRAKEFESLYQTSKALSEQTELKPLLNLIVITAKKMLDSASSGMYLFDPVKSELELIMDTEPFIPTGSHLMIGEGAAGLVAQTRQPLRIDDYSTWEGRSPQYEGVPLRAVLEVPMMYGGELIGVLAVDEIGDSDRTYTEADERLLSLFASQAAGAVHSARLREEAIKRLRNLQTLHEVDKAIASSLDLRITLNILLSRIVDQLGVDAASVLLMHPYEQTLQYAASCGFLTSLIQAAEVRLNDGFAGRSIMERRIVQTTDPAELIGNQPFAYLWSEEGFCHYICIPLIVKGEAKGVLELYHRTPYTPSAEWLEFVETLAGQAAISIDNSQLFENIQRVNMELAVAYEATIEGLSRALDMRYSEIEGQTLRVANLALLVAKELGIRDQRLQRIRHGALLHDIGKMGISDRILLKKGRLTEKEWEEMRKHPTFAYQLLNPIQYLRQALDIPYCHHEKWDGTGYPRALKGNQIPITARVFAIADVWDALTSPRPYRKAWTKKKALVYIKAQSGKHFDPQVVDAFLRVIETFED